MRRYTKNHQAGYTLIEMVTVLFILVIVAGVVSGMIFSVLRGSTESNISTNLSQNGNYALSIMSGIIASSESVVDIDGHNNCLSTGTGIDGQPTYPQSTSITLMRSDGDTTTLAFEPDTSPTNIASSSGSLTEAGIDNSVELLDGSTVKIDTSTGKAYYFLCKQSSQYAIPLVLVKFSLVPVSVTTGVHSTLSQDFSTFILMQDYRSN